MMMCATGVLIDHMYRNSPHVRRTRAIWSVMGRLSMNKWNGHFPRPSHLRCRSPQRSSIDPPVCRRYRLSHCLPGIATNAANREIRILAYRRHEVATTFVGAPPHAGGAMGSSFSIGWKHIRRVSWILSGISFNLPNSPALLETHHRGSILTGLAPPLSSIVVSYY